VAPLPSHYHDFARLSARIAATFPRVKYFVVWNELKGFFNKTTHAFDSAAYTEMYNDVYRAVKAVRPDAYVGGPYAPLATEAAAGRGTVASTPRGPWGYVQQPSLDAVSYWLAHKVGADFVAVDGRDVVGDTVVGGPVISTEKYAAVDRWIEARTALPIWWMESHIQPPGVWSDPEAAAVRVAALVEMAQTGASVGLQWQPEQQTGWPDLGLWTSTEVAGGGRPTILAAELQKVLPVLDGGITSLFAPANDSLVATGPLGTVALNASPTEVSYGNSTIPPYSVEVQPAT
jgi:hypothetical protein